jgi:hypothetical protein
MLAPFRATGIQLQSTFLQSLIGKFTGQLLISAQCTFPEPNALNEVAVGTIIADRPPHRSARALISACGSYLG